MAAFKTRQNDFVFKGKISNMKTNALKVKTHSNVHIGNRDVGILVSRRVLSGGRNIFKIGAGSSLKMGARSVYKGVDSDAGDSSANATEAMIRYAAPRTIGNSFRTAKKGTVSLREKSEITFMEKRGYADITSRTGFSPLKTRRMAYDMAVKDKVKDDVGNKVVKPAVRTAQAALNKMAAPVQPKARVVKAAIKNSRTGRYVASTKVKRRIERAGNTTKRVTKGTYKTAKTIKSGIKIAFTALRAVFRSAAVVLLPLFLVCAFVVIAIAGNNSSEDSLFTPYDLSGTYNESQFNISITSNGEPVISFTTPNTGGGFFYADGETSLTGHLSGSEIEITGQLNGVHVVIRGTVSGGRIDGYGLGGDGAEAAMDGEWINPFGSTKYVITSEFGTRVHPIWGTIKHHDGYDLCADTGENSFIYATASGEVSFAGTLGGYGNCVIIDHGDGLQSLYGHMNRIGVKKGDKVNPGTFVGTEGNTGDSTGAHLHFEARLNGTAVDVLNYYPALYNNASSVQIAW